MSFCNKCDSSSFLSCSYFSLLIFTEQPLVQAQGEEDWESPFSHHVDILWRAETLFRQCKVLGRKQNGVMGEVGIGRDSFLLSDCPAPFSVGIVKYLSLVIF